MAGNAGKLKNRPFREIIFMTSGLRWNVGLDKLQIKGSVSEFSVLRIADSRTDSRNEELSWQGPLQQQNVFRKVCYLRIIPNCYYFIFGCQRGVRWNGKLVKLNKINFRSKQQVEGLKPITNWLNKVKKD